MRQWSSLEEVLDFAIGEEEKAAAFYDELAVRATGSDRKAIFAAFANEERAHRGRLLEVKRGGATLAPQKRVADLKIGDYLVEVEPSPEMDYPNALRLAMAKERAAFQLYTDLAARIGRKELREVFQGLAQEEAQHKLRFESEYDQEILKEN
jgi:rubrerythrin